jgi:hypothetical protein
MNMMMIMGMMVTMKMTTKRMVKGSLELSQCPVQISVKPQTKASKTFSPW